MVKKKWLRCTLLIAGALLPSAFAYLDPSSGSMLIQVLIGAIATTALVVKNKWMKIKSFFGKEKALPKENFSGDQVS